MQNLFYQSVCLKLLKTDCFSFHKKWAVWLFFDLFVAEIVFLCDLINKSEKII